jgi:hypothetical protein
MVLLFASGTRARRLTQSPELGFRLSSFLFLERFWASIVKTSLAALLVIAKNRLQIASENTLRRMTLHRRGGTLVATDRAPDLETKSNS